MISTSPVKNMSFVYKSVLFTSFLKSGDLWKQHAKTFLKLVKSKSSVDQDIRSLESSLDQDLTSFGYREVNKHDSFEKKIFIINEFQNWLKCLKIFHEKFVNLIKLLLICA